MASELGEKVGETVGYRIRLESRVGPKTRIEVVTEGILTRRLQDDPALEGVGLLIFDEFHVLLNAQKPSLSCQKLSNNAVSVWGLNLLA
ncbi:ATP-dependent helicase [Pseudomonas amygdali pv. mori]|uniref:ATP-dependent helicase n=1 Tax=Pseudomonas amygdali pv. mori TaxID=34065 RepID=A0A0N8S4V3_PSEA0|nr:ATP-dependent helicase [Pseudomonas amygdali pv. mori]